MSSKRPAPQQGSATQRTPRKRRFPWAQVWVWTGTIVAIAFAVALVLKIVSE
ncbi:hypothetical protein I6E68_04245 [Salinibacterium sp. NSLL150]|uniref:hypothetical protein n=1 Tax=unclassified Salinibacterium TaxID=2632331 RepID=UPI0018CE9ECE|nr:MULTISPECIES: hypothetical protein [unclassified Salinibacterium]MBH0098351.1 hypothetical protein [Salinibacterium sp. NSLL35]MBH0101106.1 hypothetical protein [Salinibacterium sp. NSLL150]MBH0103865.1 hypothetical protein [Salinibacterium sp. NSLL16]MBH0106626.1 hypothetical protein [Salinibacterium sp. NSLL17]MBH0109609.1 hypothetical protein [Salinibacterium sp. NG22]